MIEQDDAFGRHYDFAIVGSGAGGAAVAHRLAQAGANVLMIEKGGKARPHAHALEAIDRYYAQSGMQAAVTNCILPIPTGISLGGTTTINSGTCMKPAAETLERWERSSERKFSAEAFERYLEEVWQSLEVKRASEETLSMPSQLFLDGLKKMSLRGGHLLDRAARGCRGRGRCCFVCPENAKITSASFLESIPEKADFALRTGIELIRVDAPHKSGEPVSIHLQDSARQRRAISCRTLILACGSLATPYFIRRFRLGPHWRRAGDGLSVHPAAKLFALFDQPVRGWKGVPQGAGIADPADTRIQYEGVYTPPEIAAVTLPLEGRRLRWWMDRYDRVATFGFMIRDSSRGRIRHPFGRNFPFIRYRLEETDRLAMLHGMRFLARVFFAAGARRVLVPLNREPNDFGSIEELDASDFSTAKASALQMMAFHPLGTCAMGRVVDENLRLTDGIYVCDGSVIPESLGVNPQITIYAFALRLGDHLLRDDAASNKHESSRDWPPVPLPWKFA